MVTLSALALGLERQLALSTLTVALAVAVAGRVEVRVAEAGGFAVGSRPMICAGDRSAGRKRAYPGNAEGEGRNRIRLNAPINTIEKATTQRAANCSFSGLPCSVIRIWVPREASL